MGQPIYICRGPAVGTIDQDDIDARRYPPDALGHKKRGVIRARVVTPGVVETDPETGAAHVVPAKTVDELQPCGRALDDLVALVPVDGLQYEIICPDCGNVAKVTRTPPYEG